MSTKQKIILRYFRDGQSQRQISRELHIGRKTVRKYIASYRRIHDQAMLKGSIEHEELIASIVGPPRYDSSNRGKRRLTVEITNRIDEFVQQNIRKRQSGLAKQVMKKIDIYEALQSEGFQIGYTTVCNYISSKSHQVKEAYIRQCYLPGAVCEFDWGEVKLQINGRQRTYYLAVFTSAYSNYRYAELFERQDSISFQQAHVNFFRHLGGVYHQMVYDNMRVAVRRFVGPTEKEPTEALLQLATYYTFSYRFCNAGRGNEKGHVERSVEYLRRKSFSRQDTFSTLQEANQWLISRCIQLNGSRSQTAMMDQESSYLYAVPAPFDCCSIEQCRVDKYATVTVSSNRYSVPDHLVGKMIGVKVYARWVRCYADKQVVAEHARCFGKHEWVIDLEHYLETLHKKPGALHCSVALQRADKAVKEIYADHFKDTPRDFMELMGFMGCHNVDIQAVGKAIRELQRLGCRQMTTDKIITLCGRKQLTTPVECQDDIANHSKEQLVRLSKLVPNYQSLKSTPLL